MEAFWWCFYPLETKLRPECWMGSGPCKVGCPFTKVKVNTSEKWNINFPLMKQLITLLNIAGWRICPIEAEQKLDGAAVEFWARLIILRCFVIAGLLLFSSLFAACVRLSLPNLLAFSCLVQKKRGKIALFSGYCGSEPGRPWHSFQPKLLFVVVVVFVVFWF